MSVYPIIGDFNHYLRERAPSILRQDRAWGFVLPLLEPFRELDDTQAEIVRDMDTEVATGAALDRLGHGVGEDRGGLGDEEYRRIIRGRDAAGVSNGTVHGIWTTWLLLSGAAPDRATIANHGPLGEPLIWLEAEYRSPPSATFLIRAGAVLRDAVAFPFDVVGLLLPDGALRFDLLPGLDEGLIAYQLRTERG